MAGPAAGQISGSMSSVLLRRVRAELGDAGVRDVLERSGVPYTPEYLDDVANWLWHHEALALFDAAVEITGDDLFPRRVGEDAVRQHAGTPVATLLRGLGSPEAVYEQLAIGVTKFSTVTELEPVEVIPGRAVVHARMREGFEHHQHLCSWRIGLLSTTPMLFGLPPALVSHQSCALRGDAECIYEMCWDADDAAAAADPQQIITSLEAQIAAMTDRLDSMYATARDLIALDDVDAALQRITDRAAVAVRAPKYLLAVRTGADQRLCVHHRGFSADEAAEEARALLADEVPPGGSRLVAEVASATRSYGRIMAATTAGAFFTHERDLLQVYARYAAAVLDSFAALDAARHRESQSRALLGLAQALAAAGSSRGEVAQRLADAMPAVVDSDRVIAFLWSEAEQALVCHAISDLTGEPSEEIRSLRIRPSDTATLAEMVAAPDPAPVFFAADSADDPYVAEIMRRTGSLALIVVPIVAHGRFHGILNVSVVEREERLRPTPALLDSLAGVVAQAATALDSARLMEDISHQARHDNLTGLLGHRAFHEALHGLMGSERFTLACVDIDDFKLVNDLHGHPVGDQALREVAEALRGSVRDHDAVFRVGGEEFAVLLPGLDARDALPVAERLRAAVASAPFELPLRVSVGLASWPADASDAEALVQVADAALYTAKRAGKDRVRLAGAPGPEDATGVVALSEILLAQLRSLAGAGYDAAAVSALERAIRATTSSSVADALPA